MDEESENNINISSVQFALTNFSSPVDGESFKSLNEILLNFRKQHDAWLEAECLFHTNDEIQVFYGLILIIDLIKYKWNLITIEQRECLSTFIMGKTLKLATTSNLSPSDKTILRKFNQCLVELFLMKWSQTESSNFITELIQSSYANEQLCQNNLYLFKLLYEYVYLNDYNVNITLEKLDSLKLVLSTNTFEKIFKLLLNILEMSKNILLVHRAMDLLDLFMQLKFDFAKDTDKIFNYLSNLLLVSVVRCNCIKTILNFLKYSRNSSKIIEYYKKILDQLIKIIPSSIILKDQYTSLKPEDQSFLVYISDLLAEYTPLLYPDTNDNNMDKLSDSLEDAWLFLLRLTSIDQDENIKTICFEYWSQLSSIVYSQKQRRRDSLETSFQTKSQVYLKEVSEFVITNCSSSNLDCLLPDNTSRKKEDINESLLLAMQNLYRNYFLLNQKSAAEQIQAKFSNLLTSPNVPIKQIYSLCRSIEFVLLSDEVRTKLHLNLIDNDGIDVEMSGNGVGNVGNVNDKDKLEFILLEMMRYSVNSLLSLQNQMLTFRDQIPVCVSLIHLIGCFSTLADFHLGLSRSFLKRLSIYLGINNDIIKNMALGSLKKWAINNKQFFLIDNSNQQTTTIKSLESSDVFSKIVSEINSKTILLTNPQIVNLFESLTQVVLSIEESAIQNEYLQLLFRYPNEAWIKLIEDLTYNIVKLLDVHLINSLKLIIEVNMHICQILKGLYLIQLSEIFPAFLNLFNLISTSLSRITQKLNTKETEMKSIKGLSQLLQLRELMLQFIRTFINEINWNNDTYNDLVSALIPLLLSNKIQSTSNQQNKDDRYLKCTPLSYDIDQEATILTLRILIDKCDISINSVINILISIIPTSNSKTNTQISTNSGIHSNNPNSSNGSSCHDNSFSTQQVLLLIQSILRRYATQILSNTNNLLPFFRLIQLIDFVLWGLQYDWNETRQICYNILESIFQFYESDKANSHQRKKFIRQFYIHIFNTVLISSLDSIRPFEEDGFIHVMAIQCRWLSSSLMSFRLTRDHHHHHHHKRPNTGNSIQQIMESNRECIVKSVRQLLMEMYPHIEDETLHTNFVYNFIKRASSNNELSINELIRDYKIVVNRYGVLNEEVTDEGGTITQFDNSNVGNNQLEVIRSEVES